ncbi:MAG: hypothetical protein JW841_17840 [Deltaproteobacteria bacterium]|nr:hypothetical protein [Deltaproteobacteria bacterium]
MIRHYLILIVAFGLRLFEPVSSLRSCVVATTDMGILIISAVTPFSFNPMLLAALVVGTVVIAMVATPTDHNSFATVRAKENSIAIACF